MPSECKTSLRLEVHNAEINSLSLSCSNQSQRNFYFFKKVFVYFDKGMCFTGSVMWAFLNPPEILFLDDFE